MKFVNMIFQSLESMNSFYLNFILCALLIGCKGVSKDTQIKYLHDPVEEISLLPNIVPIDLLNPTGIVAIDTFLIFVQRHEEKMIKVFSSIDYRFLGDFLRKGNGPDEIILFSRFNQ